MQENEGDVVVYKSPLISREPILWSIEKIRALILEGKTDQEIREIVEVDERDSFDIGSGHIERSFAAMLATMKRAALEKRAVSPIDVLLLISLLEDLSALVKNASGLSADEPAALRILVDGSSTLTAAEQYTAWRADMLVLSNSIEDMTLKQKSERAKIEAKYSEKLGTATIINLAPLAEKIALANQALIIDVRGQNDSNLVFNKWKQRHIDEFLITHRPTLMDLTAPLNS
jgi:hypothetical protein